MTTAISPTPASLDWRNLIQSGRDLLNPLPAGNLSTNEFSDMQQFRHSADYDHTAGFTAQEAIAYLDRAQAVILDYTQTALSERVYIATLTLIRPR